jgi:hypothetical protein
MKYYEQTVVTPVVKKILLWNQNVHYYVRKGP